MNYAVFVGAEAAYARLVEGCRGAADGVLQVWGASRSAGHAEVVAALVKSNCGSLRKVPVDQASRSENRAAGQGNQ